MPKLRYDTVLEPMKAIVNAKEAADLLHCSVKSIENHARSGRLPGIKFGDGWIFSTELLVETVKKLSLSEAEIRSKSARSIGILAVNLKSKRKPPGMAHLSDREIDQILSGKLKLTIAED